MHVAYANELKRIWEQEGRLLGWSRLYGVGAPIFLMRPPGFYGVVNVLNQFSGMSIEAALKITVLLGFCLFPLSIFICGRMLGMGRASAVISALLSPLCISLWGHTLDAYQFLGIHKQLLAILVFPVAVGALWQVLKNGRYGVLFAGLFAFMFMTHPYIAYCFAMLSACMAVAAFAFENDGNLMPRIVRTILWAIPAVLFTAPWLIPYIFSPEIQLLDPYLSRRYYFEVTGCTTAETLRQYFLGGILDTTAYAGVFGGTQWTSGNEWGWLDNSRWPRFPIITLLSLAGLFSAVIFPKKSYRSFLGLSFLLSFVLLTGPDDFPFIDRIPFSNKFQNIHSIFMFEWAAIMLGGLGLHQVWLWIAGMKQKIFRSILFGSVGAVVLFGFGTAYHERTRVAQSMIDVRPGYTRNGEMESGPEMLPHWEAFNHVVATLKEEKTEGNIAAFPQTHEDSVLYNLLPLMVDRPVSISGFETMGGVYDLMLNLFRTDLRNNPHLQQLFNIRYVVNSPHYRGVEMDWHSAARLLYRDKYWEVVKVDGEFGPIQAISPVFAGFTGTEQEWQSLMERWLADVRDSGLKIPFIINFTHANVNEKSISSIAPFLDFIFCGEKADVPEGLAHIPRKSLAGMADPKIRKTLFESMNKEKPAQTERLNLKFDLLKADRKETEYRINTKNAVTPILFKQAFYRSWEARIDGEKTPIYRVSPGLQLILVPGGDHVLRWRYTGPNHWRIAKLLFGCGVIAAFLLFLYQTNVLKQAERKMKNNGSPGGFINFIFHRVPGLIWIFFLALICYQVVSEVYFKAPVLTHPKEGRVLDQSKRTIFWNYVTGIPIEKQWFELQIGKDPDFTKLVLTRKTKKNELYVDGSAIKSGVYYYRLRLIVEGKTYKWKGPIKFHG